MKRIILAVLLAALFGGAVAAMAQQEPATGTGPGDRFPDGWHKHTVPERVAMVNAVAKSLIAYLEGMQQSIQKYADQYPMVDDGAAISLAERPESTDDETHVGVLITGVWIGSPADQVGITPGDWILRTDGQLVCGEAGYVTFKKSDSDEETAVKKGLAKACLENAVKLSHDAGETYSVEVERNGKAKKYEVGRAPVGGAVKDFVNLYLSSWEETWKTSEAKARSLLEQLIAAGEDSDKVDACFLTLGEIAEGAAQPEEDLRKFERTQQKNLGE